MRDIENWGFRENKLYRVFCSFVCFGREGAWSRSR